MNRDDAPLEEPYSIIPFRWPIDATVSVPGSKSYTNRYLIIAALADGRSTLRGALLSDDTEAMIDCLRSLGIAVRFEDFARSLEVEGCGGRIPITSATLDVRQSGTTARFVTPLVALAKGHFRIDGDAQMRARPMGDLVDALGQIGARVEGTHLPLDVDAAVVRKGGPVQLPGNVSSQFLSGLLLSAPAFPEGLDIELTTELVSQSYVELTIDAMAKAGVTVERDGPVFSVAPQTYRAGAFSIEPDASAASYFFAAAAIAGGRVRVEGLSRRSLQGDVGLVDRLAEMGCDITDLDTAIEVRREPGLPLHGIDTDMGDCSDVAQTLACVAPFATGPTQVTGIGFIRHKETDRVASVVTELQRCGVEASEHADGYMIRPSLLTPAVVETYRDHRMAMAFSLLGLRASGISIAGPSCVAKTFPDYWSVLESIRPMRAIAIDGVLGSGKTTVARALATRTGLDYLDTGAMYRCIGLAWLRSGVALEMAPELARTMLIDVGERITLDGEDVSDVIRHPDVSRAASQVATVPEVRSALVAQQREWARRHGGGVLEGRDIATVVLPKAPVKVFLTASVDERARRRHAESPGQSLKTIAEDLEWRDRNDSTRAVDPLQVAMGAVVLDTTGMSIADVVDRIVALVPWTLAS